MCRPSLQCWRGCQHVCQRHGAFELSYWSFNLCNILAYQSSRSASFSLPSHDLSWQLRVRSLLLLHFLFQLHFSWECFSCLINLYLRDLSLNDFSRILDFLQLVLLCHVNNLRILLLVNYLWNFSFCLEDFSFISNCSFWH